MKAMLLESFGNGHDFVQGDVPVPCPGPGELLLKVAASSFNPIDNKIAVLGGQLGFAPSLPHILGMDVSGEVVEVGPGRSRFKPGDRVFGCAGGLTGIPGALAEYMTVDERLVARAPQTMALADAAAIPLVAITAWLGLSSRAGIRAGETLLVQGGAGGVGHMAVQLGVHAGAEVHATVSSDLKGAVVEALGAVPIDYTQTSVDQYVADATGGDGFHVVFDTVGGVSLDNSFLAARREGRVITTVARSSHDLSPMHARSLSLHVVFMLLPLITGEGRSAYGEILAEVANLVDRDRLAVLLDEARFPYTEIAAAHRYWEAGKALGKIVIDVAP
ncbi:zinc-binding dehydrogenase [Pseudodesulfovibrio cashew]|uniref:Zinc-binding dehydrogenase n=1 Tax=Pseudodesulfovibrio cashew TaxID=2678688 RepID=A0A6I6JIQ9_9BACT|nr:zinc-dependent alcohol dehydrogenase family protein [Pseudodesulfovibrio cashew]QGY40202.1 zinc-binding dehydrogenase [Pseudodesulfovibrio cashew]